MKVEVGTITAILDTTLAVIFTWVGYKTSALIYKYTPYSYPNARIRAMEARLFTEQRFGELAEAKTLENFVVNLEDSDYKAYLTGLGELNAETIERALDVALADTYALMLKIMPKRVNTFFGLLLEGWDVRNITSVVKAKMMGDVASDYVVELGTMVEKVKAMAEAKTLEEILVILEGTPYEEPYQKLLLREISLEEFETELYRLYYTKLLNYATSKKGEERSILEEFVRLSIDRLNILTILRGKAKGLSAEKIRPSIMEGGTLRGRALETLMNVEDLSMALAELDSTKYGLILRENREALETGDLGALEKAFERFIMEKMNELTRFYPLSVAVALNYILLKEREIRKLKATAKLLEDGIEAEKIKEIVGEMA